MASSDDVLNSFLQKFQRDLEDDQISSLATSLSLSDNATREIVSKELGRTVVMNAESLDTLVKKLNEMKLSKKHINKVIDFKERHFEDHNSESWSRESDSELSSYSHDPHDQWMPAPVSESNCGDETSDLNPPAAKRSKTDEEDEEEGIGVLATGYDKKFLKRTLQVAKKSQDPETKLGAILVNPGRTVIGEGYNDLPRKDLSWKATATKSWETKIPYVTHAADEAIMDALKKRHSTKGSILYTTAYPSCRDGVRIYRAGIKEVVYMKKLKSWRTLYDTTATEILFKGEIATRKLYL